MADHAEHKPDPFHHVQDDAVWEITDSIHIDFSAIKLQIGDVVLFQFTKFMALQLLAALLIILIFVPLAKRIQSGGLPRGRFWNLFESILLFVRDEIVRPNLDSPHAAHAHAHETAGHEHKDAHGHDHGHGHGHDEHKDPHWESNKFLPFFWTLFLFILFSNLLGMIPTMGSPTASIWVTGGMAMMIFIILHGSAVMKHGATGYLKSLWPNVDVPYLGPVIAGGIWAIELMGTVIKCGVLAVRLFANMFGGHMVLATLLVFIWQAGQLIADEEGHIQNGGVAIWSAVTIASVLGQVALSMLELFVAFLQAYVFTYLTAIFMGMALHPEH